MIFQTVIIPNVLLEISNDKDRMAQIPEITTNQLTKDFIITFLYIPNECPNHDSFRHFQHKHNHSDRNNDT